MQDFLVNVMGTILGQIVSSYIIVKWQRKKSDSPKHS